jgi:hypothetical protein
MHHLFLTRKAAASITYAMRYFMANIVGLRQVV